MLAYDNAPARHRRGRQLASNLVNNSKKKTNPTYIVNMDLQSSTHLLNFKYPNTCTHFGGQHFHANLTFVYLQDHSAGHI